MPQPLLLSELLLDGYVLGTPSVAGPLTVFPVFADGDATPSHEGDGRGPLPFALAAELGAEARELPDGATVQRIEVHNPLDRPVILFDGDAVVGAQQDRIADGTQIVPPGTRQRVRVCCVEEGRWDGSRSKERFRPASYRAPLSLVRSKAASRRTGVAPQREVWQQVRTTVEQLKTHTATGALTHVFDQGGAKLEGMLLQLPLHPGQRGALVARGDHIEALELFADAGTYEAMHARLARSWVLDALAEETDPHAVGVSRAEAEAFLARTLRAPLRDPEARHGTRTVRLRSARVEGEATIYGGALVHLAARAPSWPTERRIRGAEAARTSDTHPLHVRWIPARFPEGCGRLAVAQAPGMRAEGDGPFPWRRDLESDLLRLRHAHHADLLVSLLTERERWRLGIPRLGEAVERAGLELVEAPLSADEPPSLEALDGVVSAARHALERGRRVVLVSRHGRERAGLAAAATLTRFGLGAGVALPLVARASSPGCPGDPRLCRLVETYVERRVR